MVEIGEIQDISVRDLLMHVSYRNALINREIESIDYDEQKKQIFELSSLIEEDLVHLGSRGRVSRMLKERILKEDYYLDANENSIEKLSYDGLYLGHVVEKRKIDIMQKPHIFLFCHSKQYGCFGVPYQDDFQKNVLEVYTNCDITWMDSKKPVNYKAGRQYDPILKNLSIKSLEELKIDGEKNYKDFPLRDILRVSKN